MARRGPAFAFGLPGWFDSLEPPCCCFATSAIVGYRRPALTVVGFCGPVLAFVGGRGPSWAFIGTPVCSVYRIIIKTRKKKTYL